MYYVYLLKSKLYPNIVYIGYTKNIKQRLSEHNYGKSIHTAKYKPWNLEVCFAFIEVLKSYPGAMVVISHDQDFIDRINIDRTYTIVDGNIRLSKVLRH